MADRQPAASSVERLAKQGEDALAKLAEELSESPLLSAAVARALEAREKATQAQELAIGALGIPSAADVERLAQRLRSVSQRLERIEDAVDAMRDQLAALANRASGKEAAAGDAVEARLDEIRREIGALRESLAPDQAPVPRAQGRLTVA